ncbi:MULTISPECIES: signal peptidase II [Caldimonas]|jgi:signal peptidase II|uniref:signal peptidase II n=1 Tax=Caldimonas TaxID=196013 RepID=UPI00036D0540|nr:MULTISPECIES: signal peptidase II [Caldimonas]MCX7660245.1 signal peptidase II [Caldimonas manganoxidans]GIX23232.1 MAG: lipoprotein signal peptidase [Caldimonas sp.]
MERQTASKRRWGLWLGIAALIVVLDQFTKAQILQHYQLGEGTPITSFFNIVRVHNPGAAFSFLAWASGWQRWLFIALGLAASVFIVWLLWRHADEPLFATALSAILGGAVGNVIDRTRHGYVVDFLDFHAGGHHFPAFNLADSAITLGAFLLILDEIRRLRRERQSAGRSGKS